MRNTLVVPEPFFRSVQGLLILRGSALIVTVRVASDRAMEKFCP